MGNQKQKWKPEEEEALLAGVARHGPGKWKNILRDPDFAPFLTHRSNIDLKDKWRNLSVSNSSQGSKDKSRTPRVKPVSVTPPSNAQNSAPANAPAKSPIDDPSKGEVDARNASRAIRDSELRYVPDGEKIVYLVGKPGSWAIEVSRGKETGGLPNYNTMIFEALSTKKDNDGCELGAIFEFIAEKHSIPPNFRRLLSLQVKRLVSQGKLEKVQNYYRIKKDSPSGTRAPPQKQKYNRPRQSHYSVLVSDETVEEAAVTAAYKVAEAENKSFLAAEAVKELERVLKMAEETESMLQLVKEIYEQCSRGETSLFA